ncbi:putative lysine-specific demethylase JMJ14 [Morella rubra]|uniref:Putative lysine-specific demethylase JMJ14 n=1 Tax=Morella rubra TaxID=262757 RepID=A0A6A1WG57_9ROSI|nr:putative lysine-specific demethylase JMJ14 [Morella rubra]
MGTELIRACIKDENDEFPSVPPGFESFTSFTLKGLQESEKQDGDNTVSCSASTNASESKSCQMDSEVDFGDTAKTKRCLRRKPWINYGRYENSSGDESDAERLDHNFASKPRLPKGVIRGCPECTNCQKVAARWRPEDASQPNLEDAPVFYPTEEEFEHTLRYIARIRPIAEPYGVCRIVPPSSWKPPCPLKEKNIWESATFSTRVQRIDKLQNRDSMRKRLKVHSNMKRKRRRCTRMGLDCATGSGEPGDAGFYEAESFGFEPGPEFTLETFKKYADDFKAQYFSKTENASNVEGNVATLKELWEPSIENIEGEYWRMVEKPSEEIEVLYGADLETGVFGSGFPKISSQVGSASDAKYIKSGWNLNNFPRLPGSVLSYESSDISGVLVPWLYIGMCFSSFCWHVEDHHLYSLNYLHWGASKIWYGVPGRDACKLEAAMRKNLPDLFEEQPDLLHKLALSLLFSCFPFVSHSLMHTYSHIAQVTQLSPAILRSEGVPVYRCLQNAGEFVLTFPRAYHSGFNCGFNCAEAVNVAPVDWLPHGQISIELYREQGRKTSISHDKLLLGAAREAVRAQWELNLLKKNTLDNLMWKDVCGKDGILSKALKTRIEMERQRRELLGNCSRTIKMESNFDATSERECSVCFFDLHLSAAGCQCSTDKYACLDHAKKLCTCPWGSKYFLFRYDINELNILVEALEGKLSAVYRWARLDLGLALSSYVSQENMLPIHRETLKYSTGIMDEISQLKNKMSEAESVLKDGDVLSIICPSQEIEMAKHNPQFKKEEPSILPSSSKSPVCQLSQEDTSYAVILSARESRAKKFSVLKQDNVILLSDDESDESEKPVSEKERETSSEKHLGLSERLAGPNDKASLCNNHKAPILTTPFTEAGVKGERKEIRVLPKGETNDCSTQSLHLKDVQYGSGGPVLGSNPPNVSCHSSSEELGRKNQDYLTARETGEHDLVHSQSYPQNSQPAVCGSPNNDNRHDKMGTNVTSNLGDDIRTVSGNATCSSNNLDRYFRQKGPRIAKVVRRINCNVEPLEFGVVLSGKSWCNSQAIFPKGFKSRVRYINVLDPTNMCYYISEILDAGRDGPLFMVSLERCPKEVFIHVSAARCWEMVRERVNQEITKQHKLGKANLPPLQPPGSLDGFEMFGFSSPAIVQAIEALDRSRVCTEYWDSRPYSRPHEQILQTSQYKDTGKNFNLMSEERNAQGAPGDHPLPVGVDTMLKGLFRKANREELNALYTILTYNRPTADPGLVTQLFNEEIHNRPR